MKLEKNRTLLFAKIACLAVLLILSCGPKERIAVNQLDTPEHHTFTGLKLLDQEKYSDASRAFKMAIQLNKNYSRAYAGMALVNIYTGKFKAAWDNLDLALKNANDDSERLFVNVAKIRYHITNNADQNWLEMAKEQFQQAIAIDAEYSPAYYYMGLAYKKALEFGEAGQMFATVIQLKKSHIFDANNQLVFLQEVKSANPKTQTGKRIALAENITRADAAALFINELQIREVYRQSGRQIDTAVKSLSTETERESEKKNDLSIESETATETPSIAAVSVPVKVLAKDIADHPLKSDIEAILEIGVRGLENDPRGNFNPEEIISRGEYATMLEDILIKLTGEKDMPARYVSSKSLFPDVPAEMPYFHAIISVTSQGIMKAKNIKTGEFCPLKPLSGAEALLTIRILKDKFKIVD